MKNIFTITTRELKSYFVSPIAYSIIIMFLVVTGYFFSIYLFRTREASMMNVFGTMIFMLLIISPTLTMKLFSEEKRVGTIELLMTNPVTDLEAVLGKYFASFILYLILILFTITYPLFLIIFGKPDIGPIISGYIGFILLGGAFLSMGLFTSTFTKNQMVAAFSCFGMILLFWTIGLASNLTGDVLSRVLSYISLLDHFENFAKGVIDTKDIIYYLSVIIFFLFLSIKMVETRKWR